MKTARIITLSIVALALLFLASPAAWAGCGCDHPTPCPTPVMPGFASPGDTVELTGGGFTLDLGGNEIEFKKGKSKEYKAKKRLKTKINGDLMKDGDTKLEEKVNVGATDEEHLRVAVPRGSHNKEKKLVGPVDIKVKGGKDCKEKDEEHLRVAVPRGSHNKEKKLVGPVDHKVKGGKDCKEKLAEYKDQLLFLSRPLTLEEDEGHYIFVDYPIAVDSSGVIYIPLDLSNIQDAMNFAVYIDNVPLDFGSNDVLMYNKDGFNLNLFTLDVDGYEKQWGAWYGAQALQNADPMKSDIVTYWRHDFYEYHAAHEPGGSHYAHTRNEDGHLVHADGTIHVDHDRLVVAVSGILRDVKQPENVDKMKLLEGGRIKNAEIHVLQLKTDDHAAFQHLNQEQEQALSVYKVGTPYKSTFQTFTNVDDIYDYEFEILEEE